MERGVNGISEPSGSMVLEKIKNCSRHLSYRTSWSSALPRPRRRIPGFKLNPGRPGSRKDRAPRAPQTLWVIVHQAMQNPLGQGAQGDPGRPIEQGAGTQRVITGRPTGADPLGSCFTMREK